MAIAVGVTGGIGSGKSVICAVFKILGVPVFEADSVAKSLINTHSEIRNKLTDLYGKTIYTLTGEIDRKKLASIIFGNPVELEKVNRIVHPVVREVYEKWKKQQNTPYTIHEAAILFESGFYRMMDYTLLVTCPENQRIERIMNREKTSESSARERISKQWDDMRKRELADFEIVNDDTTLIIPLIVQIDINLKTNGKIW